MGEAERLWPTVLDDFRNGRLRRVYRQPKRPALAGLRPDRSIFAGKRYLPVGLVEAGRGCHFRCEFCAVQAYFGNTQTRRPVDDIIDEIRRIKKPLIFFVDDNITSNMDQAKEFFRALIPLKIRWVSQASINAAHDEEFLQLIKASGCQGLLIGFETLNPENLRRMGKSFNTMKGGYEKALENLRRHSIRLYVTFILGYDEDNGDTMRETLAFAERHRFYIVAFNHLTPFPARRSISACKRRAGCSMTAGGWIRNIATEWSRSAAGNDRGPGEAALHRGQAGVLRLFVDLSPRLGFSSQRTESVHVGAFFFHQSHVPV